MMKNAGYWLAALAAVIAVAMSPWVSASAPAKQKVVYHVNDIDRAKAAFRNITNHLNAVGDSGAEIVVVTHSSGGLAMVDGETDAKGNTFDSLIQALANRGVRFQLCNNTIEGLKIDRNAINLNAEIVPSGVAQLAQLQQEGYVYIKP